MSSPGVAAPSCCAGPTSTMSVAFDERFFLYYEDTDLAWRGRLRGWRYRYAAGRDRASPSRRVVRAGFAGVRAFYTERNRLLTLAKNAPAGLAWRAAFGLRMLHHHRFENHYGLEYFQRELGVLRQLVNQKIESLRLRGALSEEITALQEKAEAALANGASLVHSHDYLLMLQDVDVRE